MTIRVLLAYGHALVREGIASLLQHEQDIELAGQARDGHEVVRLARAQRPDVVVMGARLPGLDGLEATRQLTSERPRPVRVLVVTEFDTGHEVRAVLRSGASGIVLKSRACAALVAAIRAVAAGEAWLDPAVTAAVISEVNTLSEPIIVARDRLPALTYRETEVLILVAHGLSNSDVAARLYVGEATVKSHLGRIFAKLNLRTRAQAVAVAYQSGLVPLPSTRNR